MKFSHIAIIAATGTLFLSACGGESTWEKYEEWAKLNDDWYLEEVNRKAPDGNAYYTMLKPIWNQTSGVLIHYHNDRTLTEGNLSPMQTSTVSVKYKLWIYGGTAIDSSYNMTDSIYTAKLSSLVPGWQVALNDMRCGDSATVVLPYTMGYGTTGGSAVDPYSTLKFDIKLVDIPYYEVPQP